MNGQTKFIMDELAVPKIKTVLNIGYRISSDHTIMKHVTSMNKAWTVLEVWKENCDYMRSAGLDVIEADVREIKNIARRFDAVIWLHGPEHISWEDFLQYREDIEDKSNIITVYQCPLGNYPQDDLYGNPYERHVSTLHPHMFRDLGYEVHEHVPGKDVHAHVDERTISAVYRQS